MEMNDFGTRPSVLETARLRLCRMARADLGPLSSMLQDDRVMYAYNGAFSDAEVADWLDRQLRRYAEHGFGLWALLLKETGEMVGQCGVTMQPYGGGLVPEVGYMLGYAHWHKGYATEAATACRDYALGGLGFDRVYSIIRDTNEASQRVARRLGMRPVGSVVKHYRGVVMPHTVFCTEW